MVTKPKATATSKTSDEQGVRAEGDNKEESTSR